MKKRAVTCWILITTFLFFHACANQTNKTTLKEGDWQGCVIGIYPENGNETLPSGEEQEIDDFEATIDREIGSVVWFPTWDDEFPTQACQQLHKRGIIPHLTWELYWQSLLTINLC